MTRAWISLAVFIICYIIFAALPNRRSWTACIGGALLVVTGTLSWEEALFHKINWNVIGLFCGTLVLAEVFMLSRVPSVLAEWLVDKSRTTRVAMLVLCALSGAISVFVENVAVVLLVAPVALSLADKLKISPVPLLIGIAICSNLQGTATMVGDPPSMILAGYARMGFWDFFIYEGRIGIFFAVQAGAIASLLVMAWLFRTHRQKTESIAQEHVRSWTPTRLLCALILGLSFATSVDPECKWFAGTFALTLGAIAILWFGAIARWDSTRNIIKALDWDTAFFLIGVFILVGGISDSGWLDRLAAAMARSVGSSVLWSFVTIVVFSVLVSGFVDNVPFLLAMIPVAQKVADQVQCPGPLLLFGLLVGACLGGNLTPIGASANVVTLGILKKHGHTVSFGEFMRMGIPLTVVAVTSACAVIWWVWGV